MLFCPKMDTYNIRQILVSSKCTINHIYLSRSHKSTYTIVYVIIYNRCASIDIMNDQLINKNKNYIQNNHLLNVHQTLLICLRHTNQPIHRLFYLHSMRFHCFFVHILTFILQLNFKKLPKKFILC